MGKDEILVVGAGPVGLMMASELSRHGTRCRIIEKKSDHAADSRAVAVHARTLEIYEDIGIIDQALKKGVKMVNLNMHSHGRKLLRTGFINLDTSYNFALCMPQSLTEPMLINHLKCFGIEVERNVELSNLEQHDDCVQVILKQAEQNLAPETFAYVIGCDGASSTCRHLTKIPFPGKEYPSFWGVFDASMDWSYDSQEGQVFMHEKGTTAFFPLPKNRMRVVFEINADEHLNELPKLTYEDTLARLQERVSKDIKLIEPADLSSFIIHHRQVTQYRQDRVFLVGDAAHLHSPAGGQGMNTGIQDAYNLAWKLALVQKGISPEELLNTYHLERHPIGKWVLDASDRTTRMVSLQNRVLTFLRDNLLTAIDHISMFKNQMPKNFSQVYLHYEPNAFTYELCEDRVSEVARAGHRAPDHGLRSADGEEEITVFKLFQGIHHTLLLFTGKKANSNDLGCLKTVISAVQNYDKLIHTHLLIRNDEDLKAFSDCKCCFHDREPSVHTHYGIEKITAVVVRPDGVIGFVNQPPNAHQIDKYFTNILVK